MRQLIHISDLHVGKTDAEWGVLEKLLDHIVTLRPQGIIVSGDLIEDPHDHELQREVRFLFERIGLPFVAVPGNHDVANPGEPDVFEAEYGPTVRLDFLGGANVLLFDSFDGLTVDERTAADRDCFEATGCWGDGRVSADQFQLFEHRFANQHRHQPGELHLAVVHHHLEPTPDEQVNALHNAAEFCAWCVRHDVRHVFVGHLHRTAESTNIDGVMRHRIGRSTKPPYPFGVFDLDEETYTIRFLTTG